LRVLNAITRLDNVKGVFIGKGEQVPEGSAVIFADKLNNDDIPKYLSACDVFVLPTLNEGSCNAIIEAMACGLPIVSSTIDSIKEQVPADCGLLVDPLDIDELEKVLLRLKSDKELLTVLSGNSLKYALNFSNSKRVARIIELFKSLIEVNRK
jgi:teichuronic acid biosynthesis glycosyltransferase TuaC